MPVNQTSENFILAAMTVESRDEVTNGGEVVSHSPGDMLYVFGADVTQLLFPLSGLVSLTLDTAEGQTVEVAVTSREGFVGVNRYFGITAADTNAVVQVAGDILHVPVETFASAVAQDVTLRMTIGRFLRSLMVEMSQSAVCNKVHTVEQRTSRWLLHASDRAGTMDLRLTHEFLSHMLGVRRASITTMIGIFARARLIESKRGLITIADPAGLAALTCECYGIVRAASPTYETRAEPVIAAN